MKVQNFKGIPIKGPEPGLVHWFIWAFFGNELDGPVGAGTKWNPTGEVSFKRRVGWWLRNPAHNFTWHVIGFADKNSIRFDFNDEDMPGWNHAWSYKEGSTRKYHYWLYLGKRITFYIGWRGRGNFGIKLNFKKEA